MPQINVLCINIFDVFFKEGVMSEYKATTQVEGLNNPAYTDGVNIFG